MAEVVRRVDADPRLAEFWEARAFLFVKIGKARRCLSAGYHHVRPTANSPFSKPQGTLGGPPCALEWALVHLLPVTLVPFTTTVVARYVSLAPAIWLYATNTILFALVAIRMNTLAQTDQDRGRRIA